MNGALKSLQLLIGILTGLVGLVGIVGGAGYYFFHHPDEYSSTQADICRRARWW